MGWVVLRSTNMHGKIDSIDTVNFDVEVRMVKEGAGMVGD